MELRPFSMYFNKKDIYEDFKILLKEEIHIPPNTEEKETKEIKGRNGSLTKRLGSYKDINVQLTFVIPAQDVLDISNVIDGVVDWLDIDNIEDNRLIFASNPYRYYRVKSVDYGDIEKQATLCGDFKVNFTLEPFCYDVEEKEITLTEATTIKNKGNVYSQPFITIIPTEEIVSNFKILINNEEFKIVDTVSYPVFLDSELMECKSNNLFLNTQGEYPKLQKGNNTIAFDNTKAIIKIKNVSRWK